MRKWTGHSQRLEWKINIVFSKQKWFPSSIFHLVGNDRHVRPCKVSLIIPVSESNIKCRFQTRFVETRKSSSGPGNLHLRHCYDSEKQNVKSVFSPVDRLGKVLTKPKASNSLEINQNVTRSVSTWVLQKSATPDVSQRKRSQMENVFRPTVCIFVIRDSYNSH